MTRILETIGCFVGAVAATVLCGHLVLSSSTAALADTASLLAIHADPASLTALGLKKPDGSPFVPTGAGERVAIVEAGDGIPQLSPANPAMPAAGPAAGANGLVTIVATPNDVLHSHATFVTGTVNDVAGQAVLFEAGSNTTIERLQNCQTLLSSGGGIFKDASILNLSLSSTAGDPDGTHVGTQWVDWAARAEVTHRLEDKLIVIAGNETPAGTRTNPWDNFNGITVGATSQNGYRQLASYNGKTGTSNFTTDVSPYGNGRTGRLKTDIVAPGGGDFVLLANQVLVGSAEDTFAFTTADGVNSDSSFSGTSFAAPHVTGAAALLSEYGRQHGLSLDHRLNGASKNVSDHGIGGGAWDDHGLIAQKKTNGQGIRQDIYIGWDADLGTGLLDVANSLTNYAADEQNPGTVSLTGWDLHSVTEQTSRLYTLTTPAEGLQSITATLAWDRAVVLNDSNGNDLWDPGIFFNETFSASTLDDLDLWIWDATVKDVVFSSTSDMDSIEHVYFDIPAASSHHDFQVVVNFFNDFIPAAQDMINYGLAWNVLPVTLIPEPPAAILMTAALAVATMIRRSRMGTEMAGPCD